MDGKLGSLGGMPKRELLNLWNESFEDEAPRTHSPDLLRWEIAWKIQEQIHGGLPARTRRRLTELTKAFRKDSNHLPHAVPRLKPGTLLTRDWQGVTHTVQVLDGGFVHEGRKHATLSSVARTITGTRWSGPVFFGLRKRWIDNGASS